MDTRLDQMCGHEEAGYIYPCESGCCNEGKGCPGQCKCQRAAPPFRVISPQAVIRGEEEQSYKIRDITILTAGAIILLNAVYMLKF